MKEAAVVKKIMKWLNEQDRTFAWKTHGDPRQRRGISDVLCIHEGEFYAFEVKAPGKERNVSDLQLKFLDHVKDAGAHTRIVSSLAEVQHELGFE